jgi:hypothetical protein
MNNKGRLMLSWVTTATIGRIEEGTISEFSVSASQSLDSSEIKYQQIGGNLPSGLEIKHDGTVVGRVDYSTTGTYTVTISATDYVNSSTISKDFNLTVFKTSDIKYTSVYFKPLLKLNKRREFKEFIFNDRIFPQNLMYRYHDINFGVQRNLRMVLEFGLQQLDLEEYLYPLYESFYRKRLRLGSVKSAIAKNSDGTHVYDVIYVDVIDELVDRNNISADAVVHSEINDELYYPGSVDNMKKQLQSITLLDWTSVNVNDNLQPRFMLTPQDNDQRTTTYMKIVPLCYTLPGKSRIVLTNIRNSKYKFNTLDFEIDRLYIQKALDYSSDKYLLFNRTSVGNLIETDQYILGPEGWIRLDDEDDRPLERE